jgi:hypothetical protein
MGDENADDAEEDASEETTEWWSKIR